MSGADKLQKQLEKAVESFDDVKINSAVERLLAQQNDSSYALRCKLVYLVQQGKFSQFLECLEIAEAMCPALKEDQTVWYQRAYCLYRLQRYAEAADLLGKITDSDLTAPALNLRGQIFYNSERYLEAAQVYEELLSKRMYRDEQERTELITNLSAAYATIDVKKANQAVREASEPTADLLFNAATAHAEARDFDKSLELLASSEKLTLKNHAADITSKKLTKTSLDHFDKSDPLPAKSAERSYFDEISSVWVQRALALQGKGQEEEAARILGVILQHKPSSHATHAVASNNLASIRRHLDFFETYRRLKHCATPLATSRLTRRQLLVVRYNTAMLLLNTGKLDACRHVVDTISQEFPESDLTNMLVLALAIRDPKRHKIDELTRDVVKGKSTTSVQSGLMLAQIQLERGDVAAAVKELRLLGDNNAATLRTRLGYIATLLDLAIRSGDALTAEDVVTSALTDLAVKDAAAARKLTLFASKLFTSNKQYDLAVLTLETAQKVLNGSANKPAEAAANAELSASLALALSRTDLSKAESVLKTLPATTRPASSFTSDQLEKKLPARSVIETAGYKRVGEDAAKQQQQQGTSGSKRKQRRLRKPPAAMKRDPTTGELLPMESKPDPERWIPMSVRTYIKDLPEKRKKELRRQRAEEQERKRRQNQKKLADSAAAATAAAPTPAV